MQQVSFSPASQSEKIPGHKVPVNCAMYNLLVYQNLNYTVTWTQSLTLRLNPLSANSDQKQFSPNNIHTLSRDKVMRINKMITKGKMP